MSRCEGTNRHKWNERFYCVRCGKKRNPKASLSMFRPVRQKPIELRDKPFEEIPAFMS